MFLLPLLTFAPIKQSLLIPSTSSRFSNGHLRIEALSNSIVRIEEKGAEGFEDRSTFHIVSRGKGIPIQIESLENGDKIVTPNYSIFVPTGATKVIQVQIFDTNGKPIYSITGKETCSEWLPAPAKVGNAWAFADEPRLVSPKWGLAPAPKNESGPLANSSGWDLDNQANDVYVILPSGSYSTLRSDFLKLTGPIEMPPLFEFGFIDSKWYPYTEKTALSTIDQFKTKHIPLDTLVIDTDWRVGGSDGYDVNTKDFPNVQRFFNEVKAKHIHTMFNDHPGPKFPSAVDPKELQYRYKGLSTLLNEGLDTWWYDRNWYVSLHEPAPGMRHEVWGMKLYHDLTLKAKPDSRPMIMANVDGIDNGALHHAPDVSTHRYPVQWTGDTSSEWSSLRSAVENAVLEGTIGLNVYVNDDLGGHTGLPSPELYTRYLEYGAVAPVDRVHCTLNHYREPWLYGPEAEKIVTDYIKLRYRLLPVFYDSAYQAHKNGTPIVQRLDLSYPTYPQAAVNDEFLLGNGILVAPIVDSNRIGVPVPTSAFPKGLVGEYFANQTLSGSPSYRKIEPNLNLSWSGNSPNSKIPAEHFSARWMGQLVVPKDASYKLSILGDDGVRLWINGKEEVNQWVDQDSVISEAKTTLLPGHNYQIKVEFYQNTGGAACKLLWYPESTDTTPHRHVWVPPGIWINPWDGARIVGPKNLEAKATLSQTPFFVKNGTIIPLADPMQYTAENTWAHLCLDVYAQEAIRSTAEIYEDDRSSNNYLNGEFRVIPITLKNGPKQLELSFHKSEGEYSNDITEKSYRIRIHTSRLPKKVLFKGKSQPFTVIKKLRGQMPFQTSGASSTGSVIEIDLNKFTVSDGGILKIDFK